MKRLLVATPFVLLFISLVLFLICGVNSDALDFISINISSKIRGMLVPVSNLFDFSIFELFVVLTPFWAFIIVLYIIRGFYPKEKRRWRVLCVFSLISLFTSLYVLTIGMPYREQTAQRAISEDEIFSLAENLISELQSNCGTEYPDLQRSAELLYDAYSSFGEGEIFITKTVPRPKSLRCTALASRAGILGLYSFPTSEISLNTDAPSYTLCFSLAHEMAHLFGIGGEGEANYYAYIASLKTADSALIYSARLSALEYALFELNRLSPSRYSSLFARIPEAVLIDMEEYRSFYLENRGFVNRIFKKLNHGAIKLRDPDGALSYDRFLFYLVEYHSKEL